MFLKLHLTSEDSPTKPHYLDLATRYLDAALHSVSHNTKHSDVPSFLQGETGIYALAAAIYYIKGKHDDSANYVSKLLDMSGYVVSDELDENEILYGRAGYIQALIFAYSYTRDEALLSAAVRVVDSLIHTGKEFSRLSKSKSPLMYEWHEKRYLGAAHGLSGILYTILVVMQHHRWHHDRDNTHEEKSKKQKVESVDNLNYKFDDKVIKSSIDFIISTRLPTGNYPTRDDSEEDRLVQWCHGAPGVVLLLCKAYEVFGDSKYGELACDGCDAVWGRGLLKKGLGLCHGIAGNAYAFLATYKVTKQEKYLHRACQFSKFPWATDSTHLLKEMIKTPDWPYSLYEGIGGAVLLYNDLVLINKGSLPEFPFY